MKAGVPGSSPGQCMFSHTINKCHNLSLCKPKFGSQCLNVFVDKAHCVSLWGASFCKKYGCLGIIRHFLPRHVPMIAVSTTLDKTG
ncbi:hypothetical protein SERLA73DRAFT_100663 [Serpula lacrymans var. lacrymans S7.3]|uniref:Helicase ATP-binding domain-containing protein n=1 Tax=Serpula lacrymans var. lacrymans (strain S7.3) TaxID=936435 RepID=F8PFY4_SERL3|nr:hypothetical protein SERLA73DRAFT_100663 [Serpula lacrymans var. lacrymans S7.3]